MEHQAFKTNTATAIARQEVVDFTHMRRQGLVKLVAIGRMKKNTRGEVMEDLTISQKFFQDYRSGIYYGIPIGIEPTTGEYTWKRLRLYNGKVYNLSDEMDAKEWHCVQHWPIIKDSIMDTRGIAKFKIEDLDNEAELFLKDYDSKLEAQDYIRNLSETEMMDFALIFNIDIRNNSKNVVKKMLLEIAERKTTDGKNLMLERINNKKELAIITAIRRARFCGLITEGTTGMVFKNSVPLGANEYQAIEFLKGNTPIFNSVDTESKNYDKLKNHTIVAPLITNDAQKLAWLRNEASTLGIEKYWLKGADKLTAEIEEKKVSIEQKVVKEKTKNPKATKAEADLEAKIQDSANEGKEEDF